MFQGKVKTIKKIVCPTCEGTKHVRPQDMRKGEEDRYLYSKHFSCPECKGEGYVYILGKQEYLLKVKNNSDAERVKDGSGTDNYTENEVGESATAMC